MKTLHILASTVPRYFHCLVICVEIVRISNLLVWFLAAHFCGQEQLLFFTENKQVQKVLFHICWNSLFLLEKKQIV